MNSKSPVFMSSDEISEREDSLQTAESLDTPLSKDSEETPQPKELLFSGGAGAVGFQMGYCQGMMEIIGKEKLREYTFGGVSAGCCVAAFFYLCLVDETMNMKDAYCLYARQMFENENKKYFGLYTSCDTAERISLSYWDYFVKNPHLPSFCNKLHFCITEVRMLKGLRGVCIDKFEGREDFARAIKASCTIPMITSFSLTTKFRNMKAVDGGLSRPIPFKDPKSKKIFLNVLPEILNIVQKTPEHLTILNITKKSDVNFPIDFWLWSEHWSDEMFLKGYIAALHDKENIQKAFE